MNILLTILLVIAGIIALLLIIALFTKKGYAIQREVIINAPLQKVFDYVKYLKNWDEFNERAVADPSKRNEFKGTDGTVGFIYAWSGNKKVGEGEKEIMLITEGKKIETEIRFVKPFALTGYTNMVTELVSEPNKSYIQQCKHVEISSKFPATRSRKRDCKRHGNKFINFEKHS